MNWVQFIWRQLNGPQITALMQAVWEFWVKEFQALILYFQQLQLITARSAHLSLIGTLMGFPRPNARQLRSDFIFTQHPSYVNPDIGFAKISGVLGGVFSSVEGAGSWEYTALLDIWYRPILQLLASEEAELGSLCFLDKLMQLLADKEEIPAEHEFRFITEAGEPTPSVLMTYGDMIIDGTRQDWSRAATVYTIIQAILNGAYNPVPYVYVYINI